MSGQCDHVAARESANCVCVYVWVDGEAVRRWVGGWVGTCMPVCGLKEQLNGY